MRSDFDLPLRTSNFLLSPLFSPLLSSLFVFHFLLVSHFIIFFPSTVCTLGILLFSLLLRSLSISSRDSSRGVEFHGIRSTCEITRLIALTLDTIKRAGWLRARDPNRRQAILN